MNNITSNTTEAFDAEFLVGTVLASNKTTREVIAYIPRLMAGLPGKKLVETTIQTNPSNKIVRGYTDYKPDLKIRNGLKLQAWDYEEKLPKESSKISVKFFDKNPANPYWKKDFNIDGRFIPIDEEKFDKLFKFKINDQEIYVSNEDKIELEINSEKVVLTGNEKEKKFRINIPDEIIKSSTIPNAIKEGQLWFNTFSNQFFIFHDNRLNRLIEDSEIDKIYNEE